jgi:REP element-mobilizing transposase RayT
MSGDRYFINDQNAIYFTTFTVVDWLDVFIRESYRRQIAEDLNYCVTHKGLEVYCWCLMTSHLHMIISAKEDYRISDIIRDFKKHTAKAILNKIRTEQESRREDLLWHFERAGISDSRITAYKFWQEDNHAITIDPKNTDMLQQKMDYIHSNPVKEGWIQYAHEYVYSSAKDYAGQRGLVKIKFV